MQRPIVQNRIHMRDYSLFWFKFPEGSEGKLKADIKETEAIVQRKNFFLRFYRCPPAHLRYSHLRSVEKQLVKCVVGGRLVCNLT